MEKIRERIKPKEVVLINEPFPMVVIHLTDRVSFSFLVSEDKIESAMRLRKLEQDKSPLVRGFGSDEPQGGI